MAKVYYYDHITNEHRVMSNDEAVEIWNRIYHMANPDHNWNIRRIVSNTCITGMYTDGYADMLFLPIEDPCEVSFYENVFDSGRVSDGLLFENERMSLKLLCLRVYYCNVEELKYRVDNRGVVEINQMTGQEMIDRA